MYDVFGCTVSLAIYMCSLCSLCECVCVPACLRFGKFETCEKMSEEMALVASVFSCSCKVVRIHIVCMCRSAWTKMPMKNGTGTSAIWLCQFVFAVAVSVAVNNFVLLVFLRAFVWMNVLYAVYKRQCRVCKLAALNVLLAITRNYIHGTWKPQQQHSFPTTWKFHFRSECKRERESERLLLRANEQTNKFGAILCISILNEQN